MKNFLVSFLKIFEFYLLHYLFLAVQGLCCCTGFSLWQVGAPLCCTAGVSLCWLLLQSMGSRAHGVQSLQLPGSRAHAQELWRLGLVAPLHVGSSQIRDGTYLLHWQANFLPLSHQENPDICFLTYVFPSSFIKGINIS